jgi:hypothetical protein
MLMRQDLIESKRIFNINVSCTCKAGYQVTPEEEGGGNSTTNATGDTTGRREYDDYTDEFISPPASSRHLAGFVSHHSGKRNSRRLIPYLNYTPPVLPVEAGPGGSCSNFNEW